MSNGIYLTLEQYKDKDLPLTITVNGNTYHSQFALATAQTTYFEMGKQHGMELGSDNTYSDMEMSRMHDAWYDEGYAAGRRDQFNDDGELFEKANARNVNLIDEVREKSRKLGYDEGYEAGKKANGYTEDDIKQLHTDNEFTRKVWYDKGKAEGYAEGYNDAKGEDDYCKDCKEEPGKDEQNAKEIPGEWLSHIEEARLMGYAEGYSDAKEGGHAEGYEDYITERQKTSFVDWLNSKKR